MDHGFVTVAEMESIFGDRLFEALQVAVGTDIADNSTLKRAIRAANDMAADHIRRRHTLPLLEISEGLKGAVADLAMSNLLQGRPELSSEHYADRRDAAMRYLRDVADGKVILLTPPENKQETRVVASTVTVGDQSDLVSATTPSWFAGF